MRATAVGTAIGSAVEEMFREQAWIDRAADPVQRAIQAVLKRAPAVAEVLHGKILGHPLHPVLIPIPIGAWSCVLVLDMAGIAMGRSFRRGADACCAIGLGGAVVSAAAGLADWSTTRGVAKRVGFVHGALNVAVTGLYGASLFSRMIGLRGLGIALSTTGFGVAGLSAWLGGELIYRYGVSVGRGAFKRQPESGGPQEDPRGPMAEERGAAAGGEEREAAAGEAAADGA
jgi:uncharacterized membrane protein